MLLVGNYDMAHLLIYKVGLCHIIVLYVSKDMPFRIAYINFMPFFDYNETTGIMGGIEAQLLKGFLQKYPVKTIFTDAQRNWGVYDEELGKWIGAVGRVNWF